VTIHDNLIIVVKFVLKPIVRLKY